MYTTNVDKEIENEIYLVSKLKNEFWKILLKKQLTGNSQLLF